MKKAWIGLVFILVLGFQNCNNTGFESASQPGELTSPSVSPDPDPDPAPAPAPAPLPAPLPPVMLQPAPLPIQASGNFGNVSVGSYNVCAVKNGAAYCWGNNQYGASGVGNAATNIYEPTLVAGMSEGVSGVSAGFYHACAIKNGALFCWGLNSNGELGNGSTEHSTFPRPVFGMDSGVTTVSAGTHGTCAIKAGALYCWGYNAFSQVGHFLGTQYVPYRVPGFEAGVTAVNSGYYQTCAIKGGGLFCWGYNVYGQTGNGTFVTNTARVPAMVSPFPAVTGLETGVAGVSAAGSAHTCAIRTNGSLFCFGYNANGQFGTGLLGNYSAATPIPFFATGTLSVASGPSHTCTLKSGNVYCYGNNAGYQLGNGTALGKLAPDVPAVIPLLTGESVVELAAGGGLDSFPVSAQLYSRSCARTSMGRLFCWGHGTGGQLGQTPAANAISPVLVPL